ncbi:MAG: hypothetical protein ACRC33_09275, partial [Gemmataceae bacterium]
HGYAQADTLPNYAYGLVTLFLQGACWGTFGGALAGLMTERRPVRTGDWFGLIASIFVGGWLAVALVVDVLGFHVNPPRHNGSVAFLGAAIGMFLWLARGRGGAGLRGAGFGFAGFGLGMAGGRLLANVAIVLEPLGYTTNHWNVMEITCGFVGGGVFTWGMLGLGEAEPAGEPGEYRGPALLGAVFVLAVIPLWHRTARVAEQSAGWAAAARGFGHPDPDGLAVSTLSGVNVACLAGCAGAGLWAAALARGWWWPSWLPAVWLSAVMLAFQSLTSFTFWRPARPGHLNTQTGFWVLLAFMLLHAALFRPSAGTARPLRWGRLAAGTVAALALIVALAGVTNGPRTMRTAATRWPVWTWTQGRDKAP